MLEWSDDVCSCPLCHPHHRSLPHAEQAPHRILLRQALVLPDLIECQTHRYPIILTLSSTSIGCLSATLCG